MEDCISDIQIDANDGSFIFTVSNYVSHFKNWWWLLCVIIVFFVLLIYLLSNKKRINKLSERKVKEFKQNKKYIPLLFVEFSNAKELLRYFIYGKNGREKLSKNLIKYIRRKNFLSNIANTF